MSAGARPDGDGDGDGEDEASRRTMLTSGEIAVLPSPDSDTQPVRTGDTQVGPAPTTPSPRGMIFRPPAAYDEHPSSSETDVPPPPPFATGAAAPGLTQLHSRSRTADAERAAPSGRDEIARVARGTDGHPGDSPTARAQGPVVSMRSAAVSASSLPEVAVPSTAERGVIADEPRRARGLAIAGVLIAVAAIVAVTVAMSGPQGADDGGTAVAGSAVQRGADAEPAAAVEVTGTCPGKMAFIPGGKFFMGTDDQAPIFATSRPARQVEVAPFCVEPTEVTVEEYRNCSKIGECKRAFRSSKWPQSASESSKTHERTVAAYSRLCNENDDSRDRHPVNCVTWSQAKAYCTWIGGRLPTEAEWEFAARGSDGRVYSWGDEPPSPTTMNGCGKECAAWRAEAGLPTEPTLFPSDDGFPGTAPVGSFPEGATERGLLDMAGNVFEWTEDAFVASDGKSSGERVIRGGGFNSYLPQFAAPALRVGQAEDAHVHAIGFRCAAEPTSID